MTAVAREANVLGALAQVIVDETTRAISGAGGQSPSAAAALSAMAQFLHRPGLDALHQVVGLTPSGAVRLVDRLTDEGLARREAGEDARSRSVVLTTHGRRVAARVASARAEVLNRALGDLSPSERETLRELLGKVMRRIVDDKAGGAWICRLCDTAACGRDTGECPAANAAAMKYGSHRAASR